MKDFSRTFPRLARVAGRLLGRGLTRDELRLVREVRARNLTYLSESRLESVMTTCRDIERAGLPGLFLEAGCALGGSAVVIATAKAPTRALRLYDVFGLIPPPTEEDPDEVHARYRMIAAGESQGIGGDPYYGYEQNLLDTVRANLAGFGLDCEARNVALIKGLLEDTMVIEGPVAFAHVDVDWFRPVQACLERIMPRLVVGGSVILDDYHDWGGCRKATDGYLRDAAGRFELDDRAGSLKITRSAV